MKRPTRKSVRKKAPRRAARPKVVNLEYVIRLACKNSKFLDGLLVNPELALQNAKLILEEPDLGYLKAMLSGSYSVLGSEVLVFVNRMMKGGYPPPPPPWMIRPATESAG